MLEHLCYAVNLYEGVSGVFPEGDHFTLVFRHPNASQVKNPFEVCRSILMML